MTEEAEKSPSSLLTFDEFYSNQLKLYAAHRARKTRKEMQIPKRIRNDVHNFNNSLLAQPWAHAPLDTRGLADVDETQVRTAKHTWSCACVAHACMDVRRTKPSSMRKKSSNRPSDVSQSNSPRQWLTSLSLRRSMPIHRSTVGTRRHK